MHKVKPFLRWAGGKRWLLNKVDNYLPRHFNNYHEPFLGGGSLFFHLKSNELVKDVSFLSDLNSDLVEAYNQIKTYPDNVIGRLNMYKNEKEFYYMIRNASYEDPIERAAKFLYLNRTSFNGIYRVNQKGEYNVPYGNRNLSKDFDFDNLSSASKLLSNAEIECKDFYSTLDRVKQGDLIFLDPPYTVAHENNGFVKYNQHIFSWDDQMRLKDYILEADNKGAYFIMTNASHQSIIDLYDNVGTYTRMNRASLIGGKGAKRQGYNELIYSNVVYEQ